MPQSLRPWICLPSSFSLQLESPKHPCKPQSPLESEPGTMGMSDNLVVKWWALTVKSYCKDLNMHAIPVVTTSRGIVRKCLVRGLWRFESPSLGV